MPSPRFSKTDTVRVKSASTHSLVQIVTTSLAARHAKSEKWSVAMKVNDLVSSVRARDTKQVVEGPSLKICMQDRYQKPTAARGGAAHRSQWAEHQDEHKTGRTIDDVSDK